MPIIVPDAPSAIDLASHVSGRPVSAASGFHWGNELAFLLSRNLPVVCDQIFPINTAAGTYNVAYKRSLGCKALLIGVEVWGGAAAGYVTCAVSVSSGTVSWITPLPTPFNGTARIPVVGSWLDDYPITYATLDVSQLAEGAIIDLRFAVTNTTANGLYRIHVAEIPTYTDDPLGSPTTEQGFDNATWPQRDHPLYDGTTNGPDGFVRAVAMLDQARVSPYRHVQACTLEQSASSTWAVTSTTYAPVPMVGVTGGQSFRFNVRDLYGGTAEDFIARVRYYTTTNTGSVRFTIKPVGGTSTTFTVACIAAGGGWKSGTAAISIPVTGTDTEVDLTLDALTSAGTMYLGQFALLQNAA